MAVAITVSQARVYFVIKRHGPIGPSNIGSHLDIDYTAAAASVNRQLKKLVALGLIQRIEKNQRVVTFKVVGDTPPFHVRGDQSDPIYLRFKNA